MQNDFRRWMTLLESEASNQEVTNAIMRELAADGWDRPSDCNDGYCGHFADNVVRALGRGEVLSTDEVPIDSEGGRHEWIYVDGKHYDSETPFGVQNPRDLGYFCRHDGRPMPPHLWEPDADADTRDEDEPDEW